MNLILQIADDSELIRRIDAANSSVALYAPGVSVAVAWALHRAAWRSGEAIKRLDALLEHAVMHGGEAEAKRIREELLKLRESF